MRNNSYFFLFKKGWHFAKGYQLSYAISLIMLVLANAIVLLEPYLFGKFINTVQLGGADVLKRAAVLLGLIVGVGLANWLLHGPARIIEQRAIFWIGKNFREDFFAKITKLPVKWHTDHHSGDTIDRMNRALEALNQFVGNNVMYIWTGVRFTGSFIILIVLLRWNGLVGVMFAFLLLTTIFFFDNYISKLIRARNKLIHKVAVSAHDYITNIITVLTLRLRELVSKEYIQRIDNVWPLYFKNYAVEEVKWFLVSLWLMIMKFTLVMLYLYQQLRTGDIVLIGSVVMVYQYLERIEGSFYDFTWQYSQIIRLRADYASIDSIVEDYHKLVKKESYKTLPKKWKEVEIKGLFFKYEDQGKQQHQLKDINIILRKGERIAFVGQSGSGKSTLMALLRGLYQPERAEVIVDGVPYPSLRVLADRTTLIPQDPEIFENTIEYNITVGVSHRKKDVLEMAKLACFDAVVKRLPKGLESNVTEKGVNLSGGEKQRLALARGLFASKGSDIILLDESTSSVDVHNEVKIYKNLLEFYKGRCLVSSIHKLHLIHFFDRIYVLEHGRIVQQGRLNDLLSQEGLFKRMWDKYQQNLRK